MTRAQVPGPAGVPLIGSLLDLRRDPLGTYARARAEHGDVVRFVLGPPGLRKTVYFVFSPQGVQQVLAADSADFPKDSGFSDEMRATWGNNLVTAQGDDYLRQRRQLQPLFTRQRVNSYTDVFCDVAAGLTEEWDTLSEKTVDVYAEAVKLTSRTIARLLFGTRFGPAAQKVQQIYPELGEYALRRGLSPVKVPRSWPTPANRRMSAAQSALWEVFDDIIEQRRHAATGAETDSDDLVTILTRTNMADGSPLDKTAIRDQALTFFLAGYDTTATTLAFTLHMLGAHPDVQAQARQEVDLLEGRRPVAEDLARLPYLTRVLKESLRVFPAAPVIPRASAAEVEIDGWPIPAGAEVYVCPWVTHRLPEHWEDPERFDPDRFTPERSAGRPRYAWFPFGGGPRSCIGEQFALLEAVTALATILQRYEFEALSKDIPTRLGITLQPDAPVRSRLTRRTLVPAGHGVPETR